MKVEGSSLVRMTFFFFFFASEWFYQEKPYYQTFCYANLLCNFYYPLILLESSEFLQVCLSELAYLNQAGPFRRWFGLR